VSVQASQPTPTPSEAQSRLSVGDPLPLRAGFAGGRARKLLGGRVEAVTLAPADPVEGLSVVVVDREDPKLSRGEVERLEAAAASANVPLVDLREHAPPVDPLVHNPTGFHALDAAGYAAVLSSPADAGDRDLGSALNKLGSLAVHEPVLCLAPPGADLPPLPAGVRRASLASGSRPPVPAGVRRASLASGAGAILRAVQQRLGVIDHPSFHASEWERAGWIARLCAAGVPVSATSPSERLRELLGAELCELVFDARPHQLADLDSRERLSVAMRRAALRDHSVEARWREICAAAGIELPSRPMVSVIFATRRAEWLEHGLAQIARQSYQPRELVCCLHGDDFGPGVEERIAAAVGGAVKVVRVDGELTLGDALNAGVEAAEGELVTKMDDDDYYNVDHLWDLALACEYSGADLVGKGAEFVYLAGDFDLTIRRFMGDGESDHPRLAGGALMARRSPLEEVGGWPSRNRGEDTWIVKNFKRAGKRTYRMHGFGYILNRHFRGHTWNTYIDYFLVQSQREWRGLRFDQTAIEP
jgi:hypothetical protein